MKHRKVIENGKLLSGHVPYVGASDDDKIAQVNNGEWGKGTGSSGLPSVTAADNGKLLGVTDGAWGKVDAPSGGGTILLSFICRLRFPNISKTFFSV